MAVTQDVTFARDDDRPTMSLDGRAPLQVMGLVGNGVVEFLAVELHPHTPLVVAHVQPDDPSIDESQPDLGTRPGQPSIHKAYARPTLAGRLGASIRGVHGRT